MTKLEEVTKAIAERSHASECCLEDLARAAVGALRDPQSINADIHIDVSDQTYLYDFQIDRAFNAVLDAILNEKETT